MKNILVIVDAQNDFIDGALGSDEAINCVPNICDKIKNFNDGLIITTQDTHHRDYLETKEGVMLPVTHCIENEFGWGININVATSIIAANSYNKNVIYDGVKKPTFGSTKLADMISKYVGDDEFDITFVGFCTDICVVSNALLVKTLFYNKANIFVDSSCCAGTTPERHNNALEVMKSCQINVI